MVRCCGQRWGLEAVRTVGRGGHAGAERKRELVQAYLWAVAGINPVFTWAMPAASLPYTFRDHPGVTLLFHSSAGAAT